MVDEITVLPVSDVDLGAIAALEAEAFDGGWSREAWAEQLDSPRTDVLVARAAGEVVGVIALSGVAEVVDLDRVIVRPDHQRSGLGRRLVDAGLAWAGETGAERVLLEVAEANAPARALYEDRGFRVIGRRAHYYGAGEDALVMEVNP
ncbi:GNAT family N-acetyltransferase [Propioniciclava sp.]|uniref:GNAT family N-acetyltransferase n=1 Tax=Propioniciclava sp. TaxID=2038686 RepID=UPI00262AFBC0|nr:GNAT family N-acetyltransferase [Propioniciclava sp.]